MIFLTFVDPNVFNLLKYIVIALTISLASDELLHTLSEYSARRSLAKKGWVYPSSSTTRIRFRRGVQHRRMRVNLITIGSVVAVSALEMALELSTGAESVWMEKTVTLHVAKEVNSLASLRQTSLMYILRIRDALQRVENRCYNIDDEWYYPVTLNMSRSSGFDGLGQVALCFKNYSDRIGIRNELTKSGFLASEIVATGFWNASELRAGRDVDRKDIAVPLSETKNETIGPTHNYTFLAVDFNATDRVVEGSEVQLTGEMEHEEKRLAYYTANYTLDNGRTLECLIKRKWVRDQQKPHDVEVCMVPISKNRSVLGLFDDIEGEAGFQLVMSVALDGINSFHDMRALSALPMMVGQNNGLHTYRELSVLTIICSKMVSKINTDGFRNATFVVADRSITAPTLSEWGIGLFGVGLAMIVGTKIWIGRRKLTGWRNLGSARGVAEHWMRLSEHIDGVDNGKGRVILFQDARDSQRTPFLNVRREMSSNEAVEPYEEE